MLGSCRFGNRTTRVIELTDGSISFGNPVWSPDDKRIAATAPDGVYIIEARKGVQPVKIADIRIANLQWLSNEELVGGWAIKKRGHPPIRMAKTYRMTTSGVVRLVHEGYPIKPPFMSTTGNIWYDSAGVIVSGTSKSPGKVGEFTRDYTLENHYPETWVSSGPLHEDTDLWLVSIDGTQRRRLIEGCPFIRAKISGAQDLIVGITIGLYILVLDMEGNVIAKIDIEEPDTPDSLMAWVGDPDLSPDNNLLLFTRVLMTSKGRMSWAQIFFYMTCGPEPNFKLYRTLKQVIGSRSLIQTVHWPSVGRTIGYF